MVKVISEVSPNIEAGLGELIPRVPEQPRQHREMPTQQNRGIESKLTKKIQTRSLLDMIDTISSVANVT